MVEDRSVGTGIGRPRRVAARYRSNACRIRGGELESFSVPKTGQVWRTDDRESSRRRCIRCGLNRNRLRRRGGILVNDDAPRKIQSTSAEKAARGLNLLREAILELLGAHPEGLRN